MIAKATVTRAIYRLQFFKNFSLTSYRLERTCEANAAGDNSSFIFTVCVKFVPLYHFKLAYVFLHIAVKEFSKSTSKNREIGRFNPESHITLFSSIILKLMKWFINQWIWKKLCKTRFSLQSITTCTGFADVGPIFYKVHSNSELWTSF